MSNALAVCHGAFGRAALYRLDRPFVSHAHREGHLVFAIDGAKSTMLIDNETVDVSTDTFAAISPWQLHNYSVPDGEESICLVLYIKPIWFLENSKSAEFALQFGGNTCKIEPEVSALVQRLVSGMINFSDYDIFDSVLSELTARCYQQTWQARQPKKKLGNLRRCLTDFRVRRSLQLLNGEVSFEMLIENLARQVGLSRPHFFKLFKQQMGVTPNIYISTLRSERAIDNLVATEKSINEIALDLGFSCQPSFTRFFSSNVGISPTEYRRVAIEN